MKTSIISLTFLLFWQVSVIIFNIPNYLLPSPIEVYASFINHLALLANNSLITITEITLGFCIGILFGCLAGAGIACFKPMQSWFLPILIISQAIPTFAIAPLIIVWLGYGLSSKIIISTLMIFFPVASAFYDGLRKTPTHWIDLANNLGASKFATFFRIRFPAALPDLAAGIRIAAVIAPIGAIVGEWVGSSKGLGYLMITANARLQIDLMLASLSIIMVIALILYFSVDILLSKLIWWDVK